MRSGTANNLTRWSKSWGGVRKCYEGKPSILIGGFSYDLKELPSSGNVLPAGTPVLCDETTRKITPLYLFEVQKVDTGESKVYIKKGMEGTRIKKDMTLIVLGDDLSASGSNITITGIDTSASDVDIITVSAVTGISEGKVLAESNAEAKVKVVPNALTPYDVCVDEDAFSTDGEGIWTCERPILERRIPVLPKVVKDALKANDCYFRFSNRK